MLHMEREKLEEKYRLCGIPCIHWAHVLAVVQITCVLVILFVSFIVYLQLARDAQKGFLEMIACVGPFLVIPIVLNALVILGLTREQYGFLVPYLLCGVLQVLLHPLAVVRSFHRGDFQSWMMVVVYPVEIILVVIVFKAMMYLRELRILKLEKQKSQLLL